MIGLLLACGLVAGPVVAYLAWPLTARSGDSAGVSDFDGNLDVYRRQAGELADERADGRLVDEQYAREREELQLRLAIDLHGLASGPSPNPSRTALSAWILVGVPLAALFLYGLLGSPDASR